MICSQRFLRRNLSFLRAPFRRHPGQVSTLWLGGPVALFSVAIFTGLITPVAAAQNADETYLPFAVHVHQTPMQSWGPGAGIYLGDGLFLTAAHVAGRGWLTRPKVALGGREYPTRVVKEGSLEGTDLTLLSVDQKLLPMRLQLRRMTLCTAPPVPGQQVVTVIPEAVVHSQIISPARLPASARKFGTVIADVATTGNSGSGIFDVKQRCLLGIMSRKISQTVKRADNGKTETRDIAKYFVPAAEIAGFLPAGRRF